MLLERFLWAKADEVARLRQQERKGALPVPFSGQRGDFIAALQRREAGVPLTVIAEFKQASPSRGPICRSLTVEEAARQYVAAGAGALSILTERRFFAGELDFLGRAAACCPGTPLLRKDFIFDPLQVRATAATPAAALLLIVALTPDAALLRRLREQTESLGMQAVVEVCGKKDLVLARESGARIIQVNARDLDTLRVDRQACLELARQCPPERGEIWIAASGMDRREHLEEAARAGFSAALVGTASCRKGSPVPRCGGCSAAGRTGIMLLKFCGLRRQEDVTLAARLGATHCGFVFHAGSPRCVDAVTVSRLESGDMVRVGVFTGQDSDEIARIMRLARLDMTQLHADQSVDCARQLGAERVIRVLWPQRYGDTAALEVAAGQYADNCALYLLDAGRSGGGSGHTLAWKKLGGLRLPHPWLLAGGMSPANFRQALTACRPDGVDCNSGVEDAPGQKDARAMTDMARLVEEVFRDAPADPSRRA